MTSREQMLAKIRQALGRSAAEKRTANAFQPLEDILPPAGNLLEQFEAELRAVAGVPHRAQSLPALDLILSEILPPPGEAPLVVSRNPLFAKLGLERRLRAMNYKVGCWPGQGVISEAQRADFRRQCFAAPAGVTGVDFALAESGTLVLTGDTEGSQLISLAPPVHIALYRREQLTESMEKVFGSLSARAEQEQTWRSTVFITGNSRTADIEQITIHGVHGPVDLHAVLIEEACFREIG